MIKWNKCKMNSFPVNKEKVAVLTLEGYVSIGVWLSTSWAFIEVFKIIRLLDE